MIYSPIATGSNQPEGEHMRCAINLVTSLTWPISVFLSDVMRKPPIVLKEEDGYSTLRGYNTFGNWIAAARAGLVSFFVMWVPFKLLGTSGQYLILGLAIATYLFGCLTFSGIVWNKVGASRRVGLEFLTANCLGVLIGIILGFWAFQGQIK